MTSSKARIDLLKEIQEKAEKRKKMRTKAALNKDAQSFVMKFLKDAEDIRNRCGRDTGTAMTFTGLSAKALEDQIRTIDSGATIMVNSEAGDVVSVTITWSDRYMIDNNVDKQHTIDMSAFLFSDV